MTFKGAMLSVKRMSRTEWDVFHRNYCPYQVFLEKKSPCEQMGGDCKKCWSREMPDEKKVSPNGYKDGFAYNEGLNDAWELAKKISCLPMDCGYSSNKLKEIFGTYMVSKIFNLTPQEALAKLKAYEEAQNIKIGDVIKFIYKDTHFLGVYLGEDETNYWAMVTDCEVPQSLSKEMYKLEKTGKHIDISSILEQIGE